jgi:two-component system, LytTR family, sensor kinase
VRVSVAATRIEGFAGGSAACAKLVRAMSDRGRHSLPRARALWAAATGFWLLVTAMAAAQIVWIAQTPGQQLDVRSAVRWQAEYFIPWIPFTIAVWRITRGWLPERFGGWFRLLMAHVPVAAVVVLAHTFVVVLVALAPANQNAPLWDRFVMQLRGQFLVKILIYTAVAATGAAMTLYERYQDRQMAATRLQAELSTARLQALRGHLQPHFLYNSLHSVAALARAGDTPGVVRLIAALSDLLRHVLDAGDHHATLREEVQIVERYLEIQRARFADRLEFTVDLAPDVADARVPLLIVQPLVENAVRHGLAPRVRGGSLSVRAFCDNGRTRIDVEDNGVGLPARWSLHDATGTGIRNLASRLAAEFGDAAALEVTPREGGGVRATVTLPYAPS